MFDARIELDFFDTNRTYVGCTIQNRFFFLNLQTLVLSMTRLNNTIKIQYII